MTILPWKPWHQVVELRSDLKTGELSLAMFAADLYDVAMNKGNKIYRDPHEFFAFTYPTYNIRQLANDVANRLAGKNDKAVRQLELTYGGGKTHTLITLYHLFNDPKNLPDQQTVKEFTEDIGFQPPKARIVVLSFDKIDVEKGTETTSPNGERRWLRNPWSILAYQIAGSDGLRLPHSQGNDDERETAPAENLLNELLSIPEEEGLATLILIDEVLMYARAKVGHEPSWRNKLKDFFQYLTQAATKARRCAVIASLLATDPRKSDELGKDITQELAAVFRREKDKDIQPVEKEDVAEVLCRRFFTLDSRKGRDTFRPHVVAALKGISNLDELTKKDGKVAEERYLKSYPFHPDLTEILYTKWTNLEGFQRTRGVLRTFALALREAEKWDQSPLIGPNVFLTPINKKGISEAARELTTIAASEDYRGKKQDWSGILESELEKARGIQSEFTGLRHREIEQAVFSTFLHSQPIGQKTQTRELFLLVSSTRPDKIELIKGLSRWTEVSWFLDEEYINERDPQTPEIPKFWRLGSRPNLQQIHHDAISRVATETIEVKLLGDIAKLRILTSSTPVGVRTHNLPNQPRDIADDGEFHYAILGPKAASEVGKPNSEVKRFLEETTSSDRPRIYRNAIVLAVPSQDGIKIARDRIRDYLAWEDVRTQLEKQGTDQIRIDALKANIDSSKKKIPESIQQAYCIIATISERDEVETYRISVGPEPLFTQIKNKQEIRIEDTPVNPEALLPGGPYDLWKSGDTFLPVKNIVTAFAQFPRLPKMINRREILETLVQGMKKGYLVLKITRPDKSSLTFWREEIEETMRNELSLEAILPEHAVINNIDYKLITPNVLPSLWSTRELTVKDIVDYFSGTTLATIRREGYEEHQHIPKANPQTIFSAIQYAIKQGSLWLTSGPATIYKEDMPEGILTSDAIIQAPPEPIAPTEILPTNLSEAWADGKTSAYLISVELSKQKDKNLPWSTIETVITSARTSRFIEVAEGQWPCSYHEANKVIIAIPTEPTVDPTSTFPPPSSDRYVAEAELRPNQIQDLSDKISGIQAKSVGLNLKLHLRIELEKDPSRTHIITEINKTLKEIKDDFELR